jgi:hypothetical protein
VFAPVSEKEAVHHGASKFRVIERLLMQIERSLGINDLRIVTKEVAESTSELF